MEVKYERNKDSNYAIDYPFPSEFCLKSLNAESPDEDYTNYINLKKLYIKWNTGLFKSSRYYKKYVTEYLISIVGKNILTDFNYILVSPENIDNKKIVCTLYKERWLQIKGDIKKDDLTGIIRKDPALLTKWWRSGKMLSVRGKLTDFKLDFDKYGEVIILYLRDIYIKEAGDK